MIIIKTLIFCEQLGCWPQCFEHDDTFLHECSWPVTVTVLVDVYIIQDIYLYDLEIYELSCLIMLIPKYGWSLITVFLLGRTWMTYLLKLKRLNGDTIRLKQLACLKFVDYQLLLCILLAVQETVSDKFVCS